MDYEILSIEPSSHQNTALVVQILVTHPNGSKRAHNYAIGRVQYSQASNKTAFVEDQVAAYVRSLEAEAEVPDLIDVTDLAALRGRKIVPPARGGRP